VLQYAYAKLGLSSCAALLLLLASLIGSYFNVPLAELPEREVRSGCRRIFRHALCCAVGDRLAQHRGCGEYRRRRNTHSPLCIPSYKKSDMGLGCHRHLVVTFACHLLAQPVPGIGIAIPSLVPPIMNGGAARANVAAVAYISGGWERLSARICLI
jgi:uncharacterized membrane protein